jgi:hypothetical protein
VRIITKLDDDDASSPEELPLLPAEQLLAQPHQHAHVPPCIDYTHQKKFLTLCVPPA